MKRRTKTQREIAQAEVKARRQRFFDSLREDNEFVSTLALAKAGLKADPAQFELDMSKATQFISHGYEVTDATVQQS